MDARQRSPNYPSTPLGEAIELAKIIHLSQRTNAVDRVVAAKAMGYSGISGRSATVLSNLIQFGLLEKTGKNEVRVTRRAVDIIYPDTPQTQAIAMREAAKEPELFQAITERFTDGLPSEAALQSYLIRQGFTHSAVPAATRAFLETFLFLENAIDSESYSDRGSDVTESQSNQSVDRNSVMLTATQSSAAPTNLVRDQRSAAIPEGPDVRLWQNKIWLSGNIRDRKEADDLIATITALRSMLAEPTASEPPHPSEQSPSSDDTVFG